MRVFAVSGYSGTGKTTLVEAIISSLVKTGHSVATVKSSKHQASPEHGTDTWRHMQAGATMSFFVGPSPGPASFKDRLGAIEIDELTTCDFLIVEGMKAANIPKFWCVGDTDLNHDDIPPTTEAIVSWSNMTAVPGLDLPVYTTDEIDELVEIVKTKAVDFSEVE